MTRLTQGFSAATLYGTLATIGSSSAFMARNGFAIPGNLVCELAQREKSRSDAKGKTGAFPPAMWNCAPFFFSDLSARMPRAAKVGLRTHDEASFAEARPLQI